MSFKFKALTCSRGSSACRRTCPSGRCRDIKRLTCLLRHNTPPPRRSRAGGRLPSPDFRREDSSPPGTRRRRTSCFSRTRARTFRNPENRALGDAPPCCTPCARCRRDQLRKPAPAENSAPARAARLASILFLQPSSPSASYAQSPKPCPCFFYSLLMPQRSS